MQVIEAEWLLAIGILLIGAEVLLYSFFLFWLGLGFIIVSALSLVVVFSNGFSQVAIALTLGLALALLLRKKSMELINKNEDRTETKNHKSGIGTFIDGSIKMDGTFWQTDDDVSSLENGDKVQVEDIVSNKVVLKKKSESI